MSLSNSALLMRWVKYPLTLNNHYGFLAGSLMSRLLTQNFGPIINGKTISAGQLCFKLSIMATDHQLSMITNSSVKPPIRAHDGLPHTLHERVNTQSYWDEPEEDDLDAKTPSKQHSNSKVKLRTTPPLSSFLALVVVVLLAMSKRVPVLTHLVLVE